MLMQHAAELEINLSGKIRDNTMENPNHKLDEIFRRRLHDAEVAPPPFVWAGVESALQKRRRRRWGLWLFVLGTLLASVWLWQSGALDNLWRKLRPTVPENQEIVVLTDRSASSETLGQSTLEVAENPVSSSEQEGVASRTPKKTPSFKPQAKSESGSEISVLTPEVEAGNESPEKTTVQQNTLENAVSVNTPGISLFEPVHQSYGARFSNPDWATNQLLPIARTASVVSGSKSGQGLGLKTFQPQARHKKVQPKLCYDFTRHPSAWLIDVYAGPSLAQRTLTSRQDDEPYLKQRLGTEQRDLAFNAGLRASLLFNRNFLIRTGLHYDHVTEVFEYIDPTSVVTSINQVYVNGQFIGVDTVVTYGESYQKTYNRYGLLDIPLILGVEMRQGRSGFSINAGISANVLFQKSGSIIDPSTQEPARFGSNGTLSQDVFRTRLGLSAGASIQWYWHLSSHFRVFAEPSFRQVLRPVSVGSHPVEQRYSILGIRFGATKIL